MKLKERLARRRCPHNLKLLNRLQLGDRHRYMIGMENFAWNIFGQPILELVVSENKPGTMRWKWNPEGLWFRKGNEFFFRNATDKQTLIEYLSDEYKILTSK